MRYDANSKQPIATVYPTLAGITDDDKLLRVCLFMIQEDSPFLLDDREDYEARLAKVLKYVGAEYPDIAIGQNMDYNKVVTSLFMRMDNLAFVTWQSKLINFHQLTTFLRSPLGTEDVEKSVRERLNIEKLLPDMHKSLVEYERQIFPDTHTRKVVKEENARLLQFAEKYADNKQCI